MPKKKTYTTEDIKKNIETMEEENLPLDATVEVTIEGDGDTYEIESVGHFHAVPNMTMHLKLKNYTKKNADMTFTLARFLDLYNFREMVEDRQDTQIIRIYTDFPSKYVEFGVNEWGYDEKQEILDTVLSKKILERPVRSFNYDTTRDIFSVYLEETE